MISRLPVHIRVDDVRAAAAFYEGIFGIPGDRTGSGEHTFRSGEVVLVCHEPRSAGYYGVQLTSTPLEILVPDVEATYAFVTTHGADILMPLQWQPWGEYSFYAIDAWGNSMNIIKADTYTADDAAGTN